MAGLGRKVWSAGNVVLAADVQSYLQDQTTQVFASSAARSSALGTAVSEGMTSYLSDVNEVQVYDGSAWTAPGVPQVAGKNKIINGAFDFWQRGTSFTNPTIFSYTADRWQTIVNGTPTVTVSQQTFTPGTAPVAGYEGQYFLRQNVTAVSSSTVIALGQRIEDVRSFAGQTVTFSFWAKADAARTWTTVAYQNFGSGGSTVVSVTGGTHSVTTSWQRFSVTFTMPSVAGKTIGAGSYVSLEFYGPANTVQTMDIWGVQLEAGSVATPFSRAAGTYQGELAACQRYYWRGPVGTSASNYARYGSGAAYNTTQAAIHVQLPVPLRTFPSVLEYSGLALNRDIASSHIAVTSLAINTDISSAHAVGVVATVASGLTAGTRYDLENNMSSTSYVGIGAEL